jgi:hypothetical protein
MQAKEMTKDPKESELVALVNNIGMTELVEDVILLALLLMWLDEEAKHYRLFGSQMPTADFLCKPTKHAHSVTRQANSSRSRERTQKFTAAARETLLRKQDRYQSK